MGFLEGVAYPATAQALEDALAVVIRRAELLDILIQNRRVAVQMLKAMGRRITALQMRVKHLAHRDLHGRVAFVLLHLAREHGQKSGDGYLMDMPITHQDLANLIGAARESVTRVLADMRRDGIISTDDRGRLVIDGTRLLDSGAH